ncbi:MAG: RuvX/YqgF family protein [Deltaproteobacteria bacterium]|nr:RuvX/YqgF family protein [Deltaproteobacteria bacterium]
MLKAGTLGRKKRRALIDAAAAVVILQSWLDALRLRSGQAQGHAR